MNPLRLTAHAEPAPPESGPAPVPPGPYATTQSPSTINSWLDVLVRFLDVSEAERRSIRDELADHLHNRIRDLSLAGTPDHEATRQAVAELGDAAGLARSFNQAIGPSKRSRIMQIAVLSIAGLAATLSTAAFVARVAPQPPGAQNLGGLTLTNSSGSTFRMPSEADHALEARAAEQQFLAGAAMPGGPATAATWDTSFTVEGAAPKQVAAGSATFIPQPDSSHALLTSFRHALPINATINWQVVFDAAAKASDRRVLVRWDQFEMLGLTPDTKLKVMDPEGSFADIIAESGSLSGTDDRVAVRQENNRLVFAPESFFDRQEQVITAYNIAPLLADEPTAERTAQITRVITDLTYPEHWDINGGNRARFTTLDSTLFVHAPARFHDRIRWILAQLVSKEHAQGPRVSVPGARGFLGTPGGGGQKMSGGGGGMTGPGGQFGGGGAPSTGRGGGGGVPGGMPGGPAGPAGAGEMPGELGGGEGGGKGGGAPAGTGSPGSTGLPGSPK